MTTDEIPEDVLDAYHDWYSLGEGAGIDKYWQEENFKVGLLVLMFAINWQKDKDKRICEDYYDQQDKVLQELKPQRMVNASALYMVEGKTMGAIRCAKYIEDQYEEKK